MPGKIHRRDETQALVWTDPSPEADPTKDVQPGDLRAQANSTAPAIYILTDSEGWAQVNHWDQIQGKPGVFTPDVHDLAGDRHTGNLPIERVDGHDLQNRTHRQLMALPLMFVF